MGCYCLYRAPFNVGMIFYISLTNGLSKHFPPRWSTTGGSHLLSRFKDARDAESHRRICVLQALRIRAKKQRAAKKPPVCGDTTTGATTAVVIENVAQTRRLAETALHDDRATNTGSGSNEEDHEDR